MQTHVLQTILMFRMDLSIILPNRLQVIGISVTIVKTYIDIYITLPKYLFIHVLLLHED